MAVQHRFNVNISGIAYDWLEEIAARKAKTKSDVLRDAIWVMKWLEDTKKEGGRILIEGGGQQREIILP